MKKYLVVWQCNMGVLQTLVETYKNPYNTWDLDWLEMAMKEEQLETEDVGSWDIHLVIDYPEKFYV